MKFLNVNATIILKPVFEGDVLKAGTPLDISGAIANSDAAVGLVASDTAKGAESIAVVTEGTIDLTEVAASYGTALTDDCIAALKGITFLYGGKAVVPAGGGGGSGLPDWSGDVLAIEDGWKEPSGGGGGDGAFTITLTKSGGSYTKDKTDAEIAAAIDAGKTIIIYPIDGTTKMPPCIVYNASTSSGAVSTCFGQAHFVNSTTQKLQIYSVGKLFAAGSWGIFLACETSASFPMD